MSNLYLKSKTFAKLALETFDSTSRIFQKVRRSRFPWDCFHGKTQKRKAMLMKYWIRTV